MFAEIFIVFVLYITFVKESRRYIELTERARKDVAVAEPEPEPNPPPPAPCIVTLDDCGRRQVEPGYGMGCNQTDELCRCEGVETNVSRVDYWLWRYCANKWMDGAGLANMTMTIFREMAAAQGVDPDALLADTSENSRYVKAIVTLRCAYFLKWGTPIMEQAHEAGLNFADIVALDANWLRRTFFDGILCYRNHVQTERFCTRHGSDPEYERWTGGSVEECFSRNTDYHWFSPCLYMTNCDVTDSEDSGSIAIQ